MEHHCPRCGSSMVITRGYGRERCRQAFECLNCGCLIRGFKVVDRESKGAAAITETAGQANRPG
jgi:hypothetical protein